jgi:hypothetical protein
MTKFHYDAVLRAGDAAAAGAAAGPWLDWQKERLTVGALVERLRREPPAALSLARVPSARLRDEAAAAAWLAAEGAAQTVAELRQAPRPEAQDPEDFWALADRLPFRVELSLSSEPFCFDVQLSSPNSGSAAPSSAAATAPRPWKQYGNTPYSAAAHRELGPELRAYLQERLPDYMVPQDFVFLEAMPLSPNGKVDRRALPAPDALRPELRVDFVQPRDPLERVLEAIWAEVLGLQELGVHDNFFELGGHSLTAIQIVSRVNESFGLGTALRTLFENPTIAALAESLVAAGREREIDVNGIAQAVIEVSQLSDEEARALLDGRGSAAQGAAAGLS